MTREKKDCKKDWRQNDVPKQGSVGEEMNIGIHSERGEREEGVVLKRGQVGRIWEEQWKGKL